MRGLKCELHVYVYMYVYRWISLRCFYNYIVSICCQYQHIHIYQLMPFPHADGKDIIV
jgi:hypothetical protein